MMNVKVYDGGQVSELYDDVSEDMQRQRESVIALERTLDEILSKYT